MGNRRLVRPDPEPLASEADRERHLAGSEPGAPILHQDAWKNAPIPSLLTAWWAVWIAATYIGNFAFRTWFDTDTAEEIRTAASVDIASLVADIAAAVLAIFVIRALTERQEAHVQRVAAAGIPPGTIPAA